MRAGRLWRHRRYRQGDSVRIFGIGRGANLPVYEPKQFDAESGKAALREWLVTNPDGIFEDEKFLVVGRELRTDLGGIVDILGLDREGNVVVVELRHDDARTESMGQVLEYAAWAEHWQ